MAWKGQLGRYLTCGIMDLRYTRYSVKVAKKQKYSRMNSMFFVKLSIGKFLRITNFTNVLTIFKILLDNKIF